MSIRLIAGRARGRRLAVPDVKGVRPTPDRVREALFSALEARADLDGARALDLFAGAGALGLEAWSRGAASVVLVEQAPRVVRTLGANVDAAGASGAARIVRAPVERYLAGSPTPFDLVLMDPPYTAGAVGGTLSALTGGWLAPEAYVAIDHTPAESFDLPAPLTPAFERRYGDTFLTILRHAS
jgi:16S rRNA (guanine966-N2)-methyltransferase